MHKTQDSALEYLQMGIGSTNELKCWRIGSYTPGNFKKLTLSLCALHLIPGIIFFRWRVG